MPDTFFTTPPHWTWWIVPYFFVGGISGGALALGGLLHLVGREADRPMIRMAYYVAFIGAIISGFLLVVDLTRPLRFWHMLIQSETLRPMFKWWSPMSFGSWALLAFSAVALLLALGALYESGRLRRSWLRPFSRGLVANVLAILGILFGFFLAGYTGVLVSVTNRPVWADSNWIGMLFLFSGASTAAALLILLGGARDMAVTTRERLSKFDDAALVLELIALVIFVVSIGAAARVFLGWWGVLLVFGVLIAGILLPLAVSRGKVWRVARPHVTAAGLVLLGGFLLRVVVLLSSESVHLAGGRVIAP
ncbi:MAG TPA: NrfD/PsrC family molybdoenzyme membrane anchor subunit [Gemmatimonadaceae bacterium]|nr:NrfD/PsrC family molybdoenzyme membrane anchor subunit [Gemmatimonadaceae bacterium]